MATDREVHHTKRKGINIEELREENIKVQRLQMREMVCSNIGKF